MWSADFFFSHLLFSGKFLSSSIQGLKNKVVNQNERSKKLKWLQWKEEGNKGTKINFVTWILGWTRVLKPGPVVDSAGSRVLTGSLDQFFFLTQNNVVLVKKKKINGLQPSFWSGLAKSTGRVTSSRNFPCFFLNSARFQPRVGPGFKTMGWTCYSSMLYNLVPYL